MTIQTSLTCRLCEATTTKLFTHRVLEKYDVSYHECSHCESLQTEEPYWLHETYGGELPNLDVGAARRALRSVAVIHLISRVLALSPEEPVLDFGGGDGFVCRLLRDFGFEAFTYDKYAKNFYADGFSGSIDNKYGLVIATEVWEHLSRPGEEIDAIFRQQPGVVIVSTELYRKQSPDWPYLGPSQGGHVFFFSPEAMKFVARRYGYDTYRVGATVIFSKVKMAPWQRLALSIGLHPIGLMMERIWLQMIRPKR